ncbi:recombinase family protein [Bacillota bacterium Lsc_1132]
MKGVLYGRVSTAREEQKNSLHNQIVLGEAIAKENSIMIVDRYIDSKSGTGLKSREGIRQLIEDAKTRKFEVVIAKSVSRLGRNMLQSLQTADELERLNIRLILPEDNYDSQTSPTRLMFNLKAVLAEEESSKLSERVKLGLQSSAREGKFTGSIPPYGYKINPITKRLEFEEKYSPIVKMIYECYLHKGWGMSKIGNHLMRLKVPTPRAVAKTKNAGFRWHQQTIKSILTNPNYTGDLVQCRSETTKFLGQSETYKLRRDVDSKKQIVVENAHPALITKADFEAVQALMKSKGKARSNGRESLFANIAVCADCGCGMHFKSDRRNGSYICGGYVKHSSSFCTSHIIEEKKLLEMVIEETKRLINSSSNIDKLYGVAEENSSKAHEGKLKEIKRLEHESEKLSNQFNSLLSLHAEGIVTKEQFKEKNQSIADQQMLLANRKIELQSKLEEKKDLDHSAQVFKKVVKSFLDLDFKDQEKMKQILHRLIAKVEVSEDGVIDIQFNLTPDN